MADASGVGLILLRAVISSPLMYYSTGSMNVPSWLMPSSTPDPQTNDDESQGVAMYSECRRCGTTVDAGTDTCPECGGSVATYRW